MKPPARHRLEKKCEKNSVLEGTTVGCRSGCVCGACTGGEPSPGGDKTAPASSPRRNIEEPLSVEVSSRGRATWGRAIRGRAIRGRATRALGGVGDATLTGGLGSIWGRSDKLSGLYGPPHIEVVMNFIEFTTSASDGYRLSMGVGERRLNGASGVGLGRRRGDACVSQELVGGQPPEQIDSGVEEVDELFLGSVVGVTFWVEGADTGSML